MMTVFFGFKGFALSDELTLKVKFKCLKASIKLVFGKSAFSPHLRFYHDQEMLSVINAHMGPCLTFKLLSGKVTL